MELPFVVYLLDTETTGLDSSQHEIVELSISRLNDGVQRTWYLKPDKYETIQDEALRINGHKLEDLKWQTAFGRETYKETSKVLPDIENFFMEDGDSADGRILAGQNVSYDLDFLRAMWKGAGTSETFPFGGRPRMIDTLQIAFFLDLVKGKKEQFYNLGGLVERYGVKKIKAHKAENDVIMTKDVLLAQMKIAREGLSK